VFEKEGAHVQVGERVFCSGRLISAGNIVVGDDVLIAWGTTVIDHDAHSIYFNLRQHDVVDWMAGKKNWADVAVRDVVIENKAWIGFNVIILKGVRIGEGAVVGAGAVVRKNVEPWTVVAGNPATFVKKIQKRG
jgi:acetyltransferase-like isoleucine patch superfamily enzyme